MLQQDAIAAPDVIVNCAAFTAVDACETEVAGAFQVNALGVRNVAEACVHEARISCTSAPTTCSTARKTRRTTGWTNRTHNQVYGTSKLGGEQEALSVLGPVQRHAHSVGLRAHGNNMVKTILRLAAQPRRPCDSSTTSGAIPRSPTTLATMIYRLAVDRRPGLFHVTNQGAVSWYEFACAMLELTGDDPGRVQPISTAKTKPPRPAPRPANSVLENVALRLSGVELPDHGEPWRAASSN